MNKPVHVAITRKIKRGSEEAFEKAIQRFFSESAIASGSLGALLIKPIPGSDGNTYGILRSFASEEERKEFYKSDKFSEWEKTIDALLEDKYSRHDLHGLEAFFANTGLIQHPPKWKMAIVTWLGVWPAVFLASHFVSPYLEGFSIWIRTGLVTLLVVLALTWAIMPMLTRLLRSWLRKT